MSFREVQSNLSVLKIGSNEEIKVDVAAGKTEHAQMVFYNKAKTLTGMSAVELLRNTKLQIAARYLEVDG